MKMIPVPYNQKIPISEQKRHFYMIPKRGGINIVTSLTEQEYLGLESLMKLFSDHLPHRGSVTPIFSHFLP